ncbi:hypothetical protein PsYK624_105880 [Phanerochaete sordida]|uniref:Uncharacterized protein n=1 Tax=Phanerochaete sordida TaxID=48140 RepID=A0A9P3LH85_9APHY|nr:hypothetical protein PsYK624_105880 [Phanerochaete sordida]
MTDLRPQVGGPLSRPVCLKVVGSVQQMSLLHSHDDSILPISANQESDVRSNRTTLHSPFGRIFTLLSPPSPPSVSAHLPWPQVVQTTSCLTPKTTCAFSR